MSPLWLVLALLPVLGSGERFSCRGRILGAYYADAKSGCKAFHVCVRVAGGGVRDFRFFCPPGTLFHQEAQTCTDWGDDDPLACPADIYDGQFDLYKIGSGFDTKKLSSAGNREEESEFGLQRAETGDRRLSQNSSPAPNAPSSDLRAAHSSDFFSGQRDRGRDESAPVSSQPAPGRQSFRRPAPRVASTFPPSPSTAPPTPPTPPPAPFSSPQYEVSSKRKLIRKRPYTPSTTLAPTTFTQNYPRQRQPFSEQPQQHFVRRPENRQNQHNQLNQQNQQHQQSPSTTSQYNEEYVEVSRVTPKVNRYHSSTAATVPFTQQQQTTPHFTKKDGLTELYNYNAQSTSAFGGAQENRPYKATVRNSFTVSSPATNDYDSVTSRKNIEINSNGDRRTSFAPEYNNGPKNFGSSTPAYRNFNSVSYEPEKNNFIPYSGAKQSFANTQTQPATTAGYTTTHINAPSNFNNDAHRTNIGFDARPANYADAGDDDGQYRLPAGEDDGQYRPELYEKELLSGAHSLNIAASGNRLPEDQKPRPKSHKKPVSQTAAPRPFSPPVSPTLPPRLETTYSTTLRPQTTFNQRAFDFFQTYTTTSRPSDDPEQKAPTQFVPAVTVTNRPATTTYRPNSPEARPFSTPTDAPPSPPTSRPQQKPHAFSEPARKKEDNSYDYAYYDTDPGFSEYDHIEEFGKTKTKKV